MLLFNRDENCRYEVEPMLGETVDRQRMDVDIVGVGFDPAFGLMLQIATSKATDGETI